MTLIGEAFVRIRPDTSGFKQETNRQVKRQIQDVEKSTASANRELSRFSRGTLVGTGALGSLGRAAAFASLSFVGGAGLVVGLRSTIRAAEESQVVEGQLANALEQQGISFERNRQVIDARTQALSQMAGFDDELVSTTFTALVRRTGDVNEALRLNTIAVDVARGRNIGLQQAMQLVLRASLGQAGALRRVGIAAEKGATSVQLLDLLQRKFAGSAQAYGETAAGAQERFSVALENTQEVIGATVLPSLTRLLNRVSDFLNNTDNQRRIQEVANKTVSAGARIVEVLGNAYDNLKRPVEVAGKAIGTVRDAVTFTSDAEKEYIQQQKELLAQLQILPNLQKRVADGYADIEDKARRAASATLTGRAGPSATAPLLGGRIADVFQGAQATAAQRRASALAQTAGTAGDPRIAALNAELDADRKALAFANRRIRETRGNVKATFDQRIRLEGEIRSGEQELAAIAEQRRQAAEAAAQKREQERQAFIEGLIGRAETAVGRASLTDTLADDLKAQQNLAALLTRLVAADKMNLDLQNQLITAKGAIAATRTAAREARQQAVQAAQDAAQTALTDLAPELGIAGGFLGDLSATGLTRAQELRFEIAEATARNDEQLKRVYQRELNAARTGLQIIKAAKGTQEQILEARLGIVQIKQKIAGLNKQETGGGFSVADFLRAIGQDQAQFGSNIGTLDTPLSAHEAQQAVGANLTGRIPLLAGATIVQNFFGDRDPAQAIQQASQAARALR